MSKEWKKIENLDVILTDEGFELYSNSDYYVFKNIYTGLYRITIHNNPKEKSNIIQDHLYESDVNDFFQSQYEDYQKWLDNEYNN